MQIRFEFPENQIGKEHRALIYHTGVGRVFLLLAVLAISILHFWVTPGSEIGEGNLWSQMANSVLVGISLVWIMLILTPGNSMQTYARGSQMRTVEYSADKSSIKISFGKKVKEINLDGSKLIGKDTEFFLVSGLSATKFAKEYVLDGDWQSFSSLVFQKN